MRTKEAIINRSNAYNRTIETVNAIMPSLHVLAKKWKDKQVITQNYTLTKRFEKALHDAIDNNIPAGVWYSISINPYFINIEFRTGFIYTPFGKQPIRETLTVTIQFIQIHQLKLAKIINDPKPLYPIDPEQLFKDIKKAEILAEKTKQKINALTKKYPYPMTKEFPKIKIDSKY